MTAKQRSRKEVENSGLFEEVLLEELRLDHLDNDENSIFRFDMEYWVSKIQVTVV